MGGLCCAAGAESQEQEIDGDQVPVSRILDLRKFLLGTPLGTSAVDQFLIRRTQQRTNDCGPATNEAGTCGGPTASHQSRIKAVSTTQV